MSRVARSIVLSLFGVVLPAAAFAQAATAPGVPAGQGANLTVRGAAPTPPPPPAAAPFHFAGVGTSTGGTISAGPLSGPLGGTSVATSCRPVIRHVVHRRMVHRAPLTVLVAVAPPPMVVYQPVLPVYRPYLVPLYRPFVVGYGGFYGGRGYYGAPRFYRGGGYHGYRDYGFGWRGGFYR